MTCKIEPSDFRDSGYRSEPGVVVHATEEQHAYSYTTTQFQHNTHYVNGQTVHTTAV